MSYHRCGVCVPLNALDEAPCPQCWYSQFKDPAALIAMKAWLLIAIMVSCCYLSRVRCWCWCWLCLNAPALRLTPHSLHPIQPAAPAAVSKQMSERVPTPLPELPKPPAALEASAPALSREASLSAPPSSTLPSPPPSLYQGDVYNMHRALKQRTTGKKKKAHRPKSRNVHKKEIKMPHIPKAS